MQTLKIFANQKLVDIEHSKFHIRHEESYSVYPVVWVEYGKRGKKYVGYCSLTKKVFNVTRNPPSVLVINDFIIEENECEEGERCLNILCKYNKTTAKSFAKANNMKPKCLERKWASIVAYWSQFNLLDVFGVEFKTVSNVKGE